MERSEHLLLADLSIAAVVTEWGCDSV